MESNIVFVCYETDSKSGMMVVKDIVDNFELAKDFKLLSRKDKISRNVDACFINSIARDFTLDLPLEIQFQLEELEQL